MSSEIETPRPWQWSLRFALLLLIATAVVLGVAVRVGRLEGLAIILAAVGAGLLAGPWRQRYWIFATVVLLAAALMPWLAVTSVRYDPCAFRVLVRDASTGAPIPNATIMVYDKLGNEDLPQEAYDPRFEVRAFFATDDSGGALVEQRLRITFKEIWFGEVFDERITTSTHCVRANAKGYQPAASEIPADRASRAWGPAQAQPLVIELVPVPSTDAASARRR